MAEPRRLLQEVQFRIRARHMSYRTEKTYLHWIRRYIRNHGRRHPREMGGPEGEDFTTMIYTHVLNRGGRAVRSPLDNRQRSVE